MMPCTFCSLEKEDILVLMALEHVPLASIAENSLSLSCISFLLYVPEVDTQSRVVRGAKARS